MSLLVFPLVNDIILRRLIKVIFETELSLLVKETWWGHLTIIPQIYEILP